MPKFRYTDDVTVEEYARPDGYGTELSDIIEFLTGLGFVTEVERITEAGFLRRTRVRYCYDSESEWDCCERAHEIETTLASYGVTCFLDRDKMKRIPINARDPQPAPEVP